MPALRSSANSQADNRLRGQTSTSAHGQSPVRGQRGAMIAYLLMVAAWLFDVNNESAGAGLALQAFFLGSYALFFVVFVALDKAVKPRIGGMVPLIACTVLFIMVATFSGLANNQPYYSVFRHDLTVLVYLTSAYATARILNPENAGVLRKTLALIALCYVFSNFIMVYFFGQGVDIHTIRYQILGASTIAATGYLACVLVFQMTQVEMANIIAALGLVALSVTRTNILVLAAQVLPLSVRARQFLGPKSMAMMMLALVGAFAFYAFEPELVGRWIDRIFNQTTNSGEDVTYYTRASETQFMWASFSGSISHFMTGAGMAARTVYYLPKEVGGGKSYSLGFGHNQHLSMLFVAGIVGGLPLLVLQLSQALRAFGYVAKIAKLGRSASDVLFLGTWGAATILGYIVFDTVAATFGSRSFSMWYGIGTGLFLGALACFDPRNAAALYSPMDGDATAKPAKPVPNDHLPPAVRRRRSALRQEL